MRQQACGLRCRHAALKGSRLDRGERTEGWRAGAASRGLVSHSCRAMNMTERHKGVLDPRLTSRGLEVVGQSVGEVVVSG